MRNIEIPKLIQAYSILESIVSLTILSLSFGLISICIAHLMFNNHPDKQYDNTNLNRNIIIKKVRNDHSNHFTAHSFKWENGNMIHYQIEME